MPPAPWRDQWERQLRASLFVLPPAPRRNLGRKTKRGSLGRAGGCPNPLPSPARGAPARPPPRRALPLSPRPSRSETPRGPAPSRAAPAASPSRGRAFWGASGVTPGCYRGGEGAGGPPPPCQTTGAAACRGREQPPLPLRPPLLVLSGLALNLNLASAPPARLPRALTPGPALPRLRESSNSSGAGAGGWGGGPDPPRSPVRGWPGLRDLRAAPQSRSCSPPAPLFFPIPPHPTSLSSPAPRFPLSLALSPRFPNLSAPAPKANLKGGRGGGVPSAAPHTPKNPPQSRSGRRSARPDGAAPTAGSGGPVPTLPAGTPPP